MVSMIVNNIKWDRKNTSLREELITTIEKFSFKIPEKFIELLKVSNGGVIDYDFDYYDMDCETHIGTGIGYIYGVSTKHYSIIKEYKDPPEFFPKNIVAFAETGSGNMICFDYRSDPNTDNPPIVYWNHEAPEDRDVSFVAKDFEEFLSILKAPKNI